MHTGRSVLLRHSNNVVIGVTHVDEGGSVDVRDWGLAARVLLGNDVRAERIGALLRHIATTLLQQCFLALPIITRYNVLSLSINQQQRADHDILYSRERYYSLQGGRLKDTVESWEIMTEFGSVNGHALNEIT